MIIEAIDTASSSSSVSYRVKSAARTSSAARSVIRGGPDHEAAVIARERGAYFWERRRKFPGDSPHIRAGLLASGGLLDDTAGRDVRVAPDVEFYRQHKAAHQEHPDNGNH